MRIIQITDLHVGEEGESTLGVDVRDNFLRVLAAACALQPDWLALTGDLCFRNGSEIVYKWLKGHLDQTNVPYELISGNHDEPTMLAKVFEKTADLKQSELYFERVINSVVFLFLDTTTGLVSLPQQEWLRARLGAIGREVVVFMHHPPLCSGVPYMDENYPLQNADGIQSVLLDHSHPVTVFCGHYHVEKTVQYRNLTAHITPATFYQIDQFSVSHQVDYHRPGFRVIDLEDGICRHTVRYL